jgi:hypothetical protein
LSDADDTTEFRRQTVRAIGGLLVELRQQREAAVELAHAQREVISAIERREVKRSEDAVLDLKKVNDRLTAALKKLRAATVE